MPVDNGKVKQAIHDFAAKHRLSPERVAAMEAAVAQVEARVSGPSEYSRTRPKKKRGRPRGKSRESLALIDAAREVLRETHPATVRGTCYQLFVREVIGSMSRNETRRVSENLVYARENGIIPWEWIVDEHRELEITASWNDPTTFVKELRRSYRKDFWRHQPHRVELWAEKGTVRGVLAPVLDAYGVGFLALHGYNSATKVYDAAQDDDGRELFALYCGDWDPSGLDMSQRDLPKRLKRYGGDHVTLKRIALVPEDLDDLPSFPAASKTKDARHNWFVRNFGDRCWELDAMNPNDLRQCVRTEVQSLIQPDAWKRCLSAQEAEQESLEALLDNWSAAP